MTQPASGREDPSRALTQSRPDAGRRAYVVIGCDTDPDREGFLEGVPPERLSWRGMLEGIPTLKDSLRGLVDSTDREPVFTWLLRADQQIRELHGTYAWVVQTHRQFLRTLQASGDELGWHPHFWRRDAAGKPWFQEAGDVDWQVAMLHAAHRDLTGALGGETGIRSVRMGWVYHNNRTYAALEQLGIAVDFSAIPGLRTYRGTPPARGNNLFDWHSTPLVPYRPSRADYRRPAQAGEESSGLLEAPYFVSTSRLWGLVANAQLARKTGHLTQLWDGIRRPGYCINLTARPRYFAPLVSQFRRALRAADARPVVFATGFHPDELLPNRSALYRVDSVRVNLAALLHAGRDADVPIEFTPAGRLPDIWPA